MLRKLFYLILLAIVFFLGLFMNRVLEATDKQTSLPIPKVIPRPLEKYTIENLSKTDIKVGQFEMDLKLSDIEDYSPHIFRFRFNPNLDGKDMKVSEGQINLPAGLSNKNKAPLIIMLRGYIDQSLYRVGDGTRKAAEVFAKNGFITVAPDFLGYGGSDKEAENIFETRFQTYVTVLSLIKSLDQIPEWDGKNVFLWGHSNGGQIALTVLEISGVNYPSTLWAPVSKPFPYSILYYTDESEDHGKLIRSELAKFEELYDVELYSLTNYLDRINTPLQIHQGTSDNEVPISWTNELVDTLKKDGKPVEYFTYPAADHNLRPSWDLVVKKDLEFFKSHLK
ncbi:hypothetical protein A2962_00825 [Candidatus Woesebacteria bacterium RIFCSPLOWO2_01_FULL_39_61]|uniref:Peptidase S9 prolyl oligopeptidase catalytic domain-containing protein n=1 Tax=Candidatus Woesebacteria bacterium RIFCSPHIGHO2_02_FULL_39_13 TaxID=1802505 RepID=A0A1F7YZ85_9BACT|nr:MAG: hypothetical protein A2692_03630 [Candidatus Woesebacteria bacterium RIFCSPHIGHO2_01_FULL_39_95]OGM31785.1 MAG: hypothetical protein A3D01_05440 [Candidatus Woesebacteria bacterium RIFCSPHIGHO2_02_FULL_39_13]OGM36459.1 MAG: hypothetical protein A3E13_02320 [Candidatus Woesebacteria bacterium RIFCSPHIGHO2_12_FULL_40_20]OGM68750.1 MAG: hypothetical protein A2962_00825 [Candidatus Woesebacteria bacterium RIFCSPLOWO2_01_FULL_39_61]OGM75096.1 MAG: hypothetical protein A3H19_01815 [Candidatus